MRTVSQQSDTSLALKETASSVALNINFQKTKAFVINSDSNTLVVEHQQIEPVSDFRYLSSVIASLLKILNNDVALHGPCSGDWKVFDALKHSASQLSSDFSIVLLWPSCRTDLKLGL